MSDETAARAALIALRDAMFDQADDLHDTTPQRDDYNALFDLVIAALKAAGLPEVPPDEPANDHDA